MANPTGRESHHLHIVRCVLAVMQIFHTLSSVDDFVQSNISVSTLYNPYADFPPGVNLMAVIPANNKMTNTPIPSGMYILSIT